MSLFDGFDLDEPLNKKPKPSGTSTPSTIPSLKAPSHPSNDVHPAPEPHKADDAPAHHFTAVHRQDITGAVPTARPLVLAEDCVPVLDSENAKACHHQVLLPPDFDPLVAQQNKNISLRENMEPARKYSFPLDPFQQEAIKALEAGESVLVAAHTSAGKTVCAEYAIAMALRDGARVVYTSPIKALSNQKYRDFAQIFGESNVGLMTGDVTISPSASCLVLTTEILRSMLYRGSEIMREVQWVVFDEIHYLRDKERGVVWEETLIMLPRKVHYVFLSATVPNAPEFASWIARLHHQSVHVVYTAYRPTPLQHYLFVQGGSGIHMVVDEQGRFNQDNFNRALSALTQDNILGAGAIGDKKRKQTATSDNDVFKIVKLIVERNYDPAIIFGFSRKEVEKMAERCAKLDLHSPEEKRLVTEVFNSAMASLSEEDRALPMIGHMLPLLKRGIGIHHSGLLPLLKEVIELLFQENLIKILFATETFSIGLNMPARTVVFTAVKKFDGTQFRVINPGEYTQMAGRAGRRGKDARGLVIVMLDEKLDPDQAKTILRGGADPLYSAFHLSYNTLLNLMRIDSMPPEELLAKSFLQFQNERALPALEHQLEQLESEYKNTVIHNEDDFDTYFRISQELQRYTARVQAVMLNPRDSLKFFQPGRLLYIREGKIDWGWGICVYYKRTGGDQGRGRKELQHEDEARTNYTVDVLLLCDTDPALNRPQPARSPANGELRVVPVLHSLVERLSSLRLLMPSDIRPLDARKKLLFALEQATKKFGTASIPLLDPIDDMKIKAPGIREDMERMRTLEEQLRTHPLTITPDPENRERYERKRGLEQQLSELNDKIKTTREIVCRDSLRHMKNVLRKLEFVDEKNVIQMKGRAACEINAADELLVTQLILQGSFNDLSPQISAALLSCLVYQEKGDENLRLIPELEAPLRVLQETAREIGRTCLECKIPIDVKEYVTSFRPDLMPVVHAWVQGQSFATICRTTTIFEGTIIRCMRRLDELLKQLVSACSTIGETGLAEKFEESSRLLKRDIVFAASLYI